MTRKENQLKKLKSRGGEANIQIMTIQHMHRKHTDSLVPSWNDSMIIFFKYNVRCTAKIESGVILFCAQKKSYTLKG